MGGSGRQSACKLATFMVDYSLYQIEISKNYTTTEWREDLKKLLLRAGAEGKKTTFLFSDNQIKVIHVHCNRKTSQSMCPLCQDESFVEDLNMILNTGDVPNLYPPDEKAEIIEKMQVVARTQVSSVTTHDSLPASTVWWSLSSCRDVRLMPLPSLCTTSSLRESRSTSTWSLP